MSAKRILIVDDHDQIRLSISEILELQGYEVQTAINGKDAMEKVTGFQPDLIVTDILMPDMDGYELMMKKWTDQQIYEIPIIVVSASLTLVALKRKKPPEVSLWRQRTKSVAASLQ